MAAAGLRVLLGGPARELRVVLSTRFGTYLETRTGEPVALLTAEAARLPFALVLAPGTPAAATTPTCGARIGDGSLELDGHRYVAGRWAPDERLTTRPLTGRVLRRADDLLARAADCGVARARRLTMAAALGTGDVVAVDAAADRLVGYGPGATPAGDDLVAGLITALTTYDHPSAAALGSSVTTRLARTTWLSTALLASTIDRRPAADLADLPRYADGPPDRWRAVVERLLRFGHTSGAAAAHGFALGVRLADEAGRRD